ncbi:hypothetical protein [Paenibacillus gansuensis]|uniref:Uncharacterized protein n=1 Tax=Paenibacillus gansuensis TaxID=306542 RepID=A0ABW5PK68_9BACL
MSYGRTLNATGNKRANTNGNTAKPRKQAITMNEDGFTYVTYAPNKRPLKLAVYWVTDEMSADILRQIIEFVTRMANKPVHLRNMEPPKFWALCERLATMYCRTYSPTTNYGITKPEIRAAVYFVMLAGITAGEWPEKYPVTDKTFVKYG